MRKRGMYRMSIKKIVYTVDSSVEPERRKIAFAGADSNNPLVEVKSMEFHELTYKNKAYITESYSVLKTLIDTVTAIQEKYAKMQVASQSEEVVEPVKKGKSKQAEKEPVQPTPQEQVDIMVSELYGLVDLVVADNPEYIEEVLSVINNQLQKESNDPTSRKLITFNNNPALSIGSLEGLLQDFPVRELKRLITHFLACVQLTK